VPNWQFMRMVFLSTIGAKIMIDLSKNFMTIGTRS
jgi:hypothetical protein